MQSSMLTNKLRQNKMMVEVYLKLNNGIKLNLFKNL